MNYQTAEGKQCAAALCDLLMMSSAGGTSPRSRGLIPPVALIEYSALRLALFRQFRLVFMVHGYASSMFLNQQAKKGSFGKCIGWNSLINWWDELRQGVNYQFDLMKVIWIVLLVVAGLTPETAALDSSRPDPPRPDIVDNNHYFSESTKTKNYKITDLKKDAPISVVLKPQSSIKQGPITITIQSGSAKKTCQFTSLHGLCVLDAAQDVTGSLDMSCSNLPCQVTWAIYQMPASKLQTSETLSELYQIPGGAKSMHLALTCPTQQVADAFKLALPFSDMQIESIVIQKALYISFRNPQQGYILFKKNPQFKSCLKLAVSRVGSNIADELESDLIKKGDKAVYPFLAFPAGLFRFDMEFTCIQQEGIPNSTSTISITGEQGGSRQIIRTNQITFPKAQNTYAMNYAVPAIDKSVWSNIQLQIETRDAYVLVDFQMADDDRIMMEATQRSVFDLKKGEKLPIRLVKEEHAEKGDTVNILLSPDSKLSANKKSCDLGPECDFEVEAKEDVKGILYLGKQDTNKEVLILDMKGDMKFKKKVKEFTQTYIKKKVELKKALQVTINTGNVIVYMATSTKQCGLPSPTCYDAVGSMHKNFLFTPETADDETVIFLIHALDNCEFTFTLLTADAEFVELEDSVPFAYLFDEKEEQLRLKFRRTAKKDVNFNLIGPLHALDLVVENSKDLPKDIESAQVSAEGYLSFPAKETKQDDFSILVRKREAYKDRMVHFTIIASSSGKEIRLETGVTHYETLPKEGYSNAEYVFEFDEKEDFILNFYCHNVKSEDVRIKMMVSTMFKKQQKELTEEEKSKNIKTFQIDKASDMLDLSTVSKDLCSGKGQAEDNCEVFLVLQNAMDMEVDIAITLMTHHSVVQLKDGVWQSFSLNSVAKSAHFFFYPHNPKEDINLLYKSADPNVRLRYRMFYGDEDNINPAEWPFPNEKTSEVESATHSKFKPVNHMSISKDQFATCWPYCVLLVSMAELNTQERQGSFSMMASNSIMEIPEKEKIDIAISGETEKIYLVDLKYALDQGKDIYFYVYHSIGLVNIYMNVYSERNDRVPDAEESDFSIIGKNELHVPIDRVKQILESEEMDEHNNIYLYLLVEAITDSKLSIEFEFSDEESDRVKMISFDSFENVRLSKQSSKIFYTSIEQPYELKIIRNNGFPFYYGTTCKDKLDKCVKDFQAADTKGTQLLTKVAAYNEPPCKDCYQLFKVSTEEDPGEVTIHLQSAATEIELIQSKPVYDFTEKQEVNRYSMYAIREEETFLNIDLSEGEVEVEVTDLNRLNITKSGSKLISITIPASKKPSKKTLDVKAAEELVKMEKEELTQEKKEALMKKYMESVRTTSESTLSGFSLSDKFTLFHVTVRSKSSSPSIYTITYSSGEREFDLQDGLITEYTLEENKQAVFYYSSRTAGHAYLTIAMEKAAYLQDLDVSLKSCDPKDGLIDEDCWVSFSTAKPPIKEKTPNPTIMYSLPSKNFFAVFLTYKGKHEQSVSLGINHQQIMILPFDKEYPFVLHSGEHVNFLVELSNPGYISMVVRKCDESSPTFAYTYDYDGFQQNEFTYETQLAENPKSSFYSKVKPGTLYCHLESPNEQSLLSIYVKFSETKMKETDMKPGNNGDLTYSIVDSSTAEITLHPPICAKSACSKKLKYTLMTTTKRLDLYTQLVCPNNFFVSYETVSIDPIKEQVVTPKTNSDGSLSFTFALVDQISFVGVKVSDGKASQDIYYRPIQVATMWGQLSRTSHGHKLAISTVFICALLGVVICVRRSARKGYKPIEDEI